MHQIMTGHEECVQMLLEQEVSILCKDSRGRTPLHYAAARGHATWLSELLQMALSEEDCSFKDNQGYTPLHWACYNGKLIVTWLIAADFLPQQPLWSQRGWEHNILLKSMVSNHSTFKILFFFFPLRGYHDAFMEWKFAFPFFVNW